LSWVNEATGKGFSLEYPHISVHAISRDLTSFPSELLYCQLDINLNESQGTYKTFATSFAPSSAAASSPASKL
jgi:hypothetical protein